MPKLSTAVAASALLVALSAPSFAADVDTSTSQHNSTAIQNQDNLKSGTSTQLKDKQDLGGATSFGSKDQDRDRDRSAQMPRNATTDKDRDIDRDQSAQLPGNAKTDQDRDIHRDQSAQSPSKSSMDQDRDVDRDQSAQAPSKSSMDQDRDTNRDQSARLPGKDQDKSPGRSSMSPGHEMQENGSVPGSPGASGYAPGH